VYKKASPTCGFAISAAPTGVGMPLKAGDTSDVQSKTSCSPVSGIPSLSSSTLR